VMRELGIRSLIAVPLWSSNTMIAILTAVNKKGGETFDRRDLRLLTIFSNLGAASLQNAFLYGDLKRKMDELRQTQYQLVHSTKLAAIGELATNLAHEINNPLTSVLGYTSHLLRTFSGPEESLQKLRIIEQETLRVRKIIRNLLDFSRRGNVWRQTGDLAMPLKETVALLQGVAERSGVRISESYPSDPMTVDMDQNELKQVFLNIMNNALHAMPGGGELQIRLFVAEGGWVVIEFKDTGHGITREIIGRVFEPFFTTKNNGDGTGLGLSISNRIVQNHGGRIEVSSIPGEGAAFRIVLPRGDQSSLRPIRREA
jgi:signal transduction histidine kinase